MTPALKAMVEAIVLAFQEQAGERYPEATRTVQDPSLIFLNGDFDLEKVARAGLEAIRWPEDAEAQVDIILAGADVPDSVQRFWPPMIDAILKAAP
jgi:hypothetical protein